LEPELLAHELALAVGQWFGLTEPVEPRVKLEHNLMSRPQVPRLQLRILYRL